MGKLSISVPAELERRLRERAASDGVSISAFLAAALERDFRYREQLEAAERLFDEAVAVNGPPTEKDWEDINAFMREVHQFENGHPQSTGEDAPEPAQWAEAS